MAKQTHKQIVLNELLAGNHVTAPRMWGLYGITRLSAHIYTLRNEGYEIANYPSDIYKGYDNYSLDIEALKLEKALSVEADVFETIQEKYYEGGDGLNTHVSLTSEFLYEMGAKMLDLELKQSCGTLEVA